MLFAKHILTIDEFELAKEKGVTVFLYNESSFIPKQEEGIVIINCTTQRVPSTWFTWQQNDELLQSFKEKFPDFFQWGKYDLTLAFQKALYWANQKTGFLHYVKENKFSNETVYKEEALHSYSPYKIALKFFKELLLNNKTEQLEVQRDLKNKKGIFIRHEFQLTLYKHILQKAVIKDDFIIFTHNPELVKKIKSFGISDDRVILIKSHNTKKLPYINLLNLKGKDWFVLNQILISWKEVSEWFLIAEQIANSGISSFLMNEGENGIFGAVMGEVMKQNGIKSFNTMNGMKSGQAQDAFINFDYWFVWDEQMKKLLIEKCHLPADKLIISGHLMEDEVADYKYSNSLGLSEDDIQNKKIISLFSVRGKREEKVFTFRYLYKIAEQNPDILLLLRPHPSETEEDRINPPSNLKNVKWIEFNQQNSKQTLYDQLSISNLSICFGSTVALESKWFGVPCFTVEMREESMIYAVDGENILHIRNLEELEEKTATYLNKEKSSGFKFTNTANNILDCL